ncbi:MAG: tetratricopeptide repeat protein [Oscillospiraceae bacterium]|nr:tetratricopeptide repeat protein [Oscillospiraceae bacterium]
MDVKEMLAKLDYFYEQGRLKDAEKLLDSSLEAAEENRNYSAMLTVYNEMEGLYRTTGRAGKAADISDKALSLIVQMGLGNTTHHATTLQNGATANRVAGNRHKALDMYCQAAEIYKNLGMQTSYQMASLYNNISHIYQEEKQYDKALEYLNLALNTVSELPDSDAEIATTRVCLGLCLMSVKRMDEAKTQILKALNYYESPLGACDGHYGSALSSMGEYMWRQKEYSSAVMYYEKALKVTIERFGENYGCKIIRSNLAKLKDEMENNSLKG